MPSGGLYSIEDPSIKLLTKYFGEYSIGSKAYRTQGKEDPLFREVARVLFEYGFVHLRPLAMSKNRAGFVITTFEGLKVDWLVIVAESLRVGEKAWCGLAQWLTLLVPPTPALKPKKLARSTDTTPKKPSKW